MKQVTEDVNGANNSSTINANIDIDVDRVNNLGTGKKKTIGSNCNRNSEIKFLKIVSFLLRI